MVTRIVSNTFAVGGVITRVNISKTNKIVNWSVECGLYRQTSISITHFNVFINNKSQGNLSNTASHVFQLIQNSFTTIDSGSCECDVSSFPVEVDLQSREFGVCNISFDFISYDVTYNGNGGVYNNTDTYIDDRQNPVALNASYTIKKNMFTKDGYRFKYWLAKQEDNYFKTSGGVYFEYPNSSIQRIWLSEMNIDGKYGWEVIVYSPNAYSVKVPTWTSYNDQDDIIWHELSAGSWTRNGKYFNFGAQIFTSQHNNELIDYISHIYAYDSSGNQLNCITDIKPYSVEFYQNDPYIYALGKDITLYAQWAKEYILSYDANGGIGDSYEQKVIAGQTITIDENTFTHETDKYTGWYLKRNDDTWYTTSNIWATEEEISENGYDKMLHVSGQSLTINSSWIVSDETSFSLCVVWESGNTVIFYPNNKTGEVTRIICFEGEDFVIPSDVPTLDKHTFIYWTTASDGTGDIYYPNDVVFIDEENPPTFVETGLYAQYINFNVYVYPDGTIEAVGFVEDDSYQGVDGNGIIHMPQFIQHNINNVQFGNSGLYAFAFRNKQKHDSLT